MCKILVIEGSSDSDSRGEGCATVDFSLSFHFSLANCRSLMFKLGANSNRSTYKLLLLIVM